MSKELRDKAAGPFLKGHDTVLVVYIHNCVHVCVCVCDICEVKFSTQH